MIDTKTIAESNHFIILDKYTKIEQTGADYQTEAELEREFIADLQCQGYEYLPRLTNHDKLLVNLRQQLQKLNNVVFLDTEW